MSFSWEALAAKLKNCPTTINWDLAAENDEPVFDPNRGVISFRA